MPSDTGFKARPSSASDAVEFHADSVTIDGVIALLERVKVSWGVPGSAVDVSAANPLPTVGGNVASALVNGRQVVPAPGTPVALRGALACRWVTVTALPANTGQVNVGGAGVLATTGGATGVPLIAGASVTIPVADASLLFVDARVAGEGVSFMVGS